MPPLDPDVLALLALGENVASAEEEAHVETCPQCRAELGNLRRTATVGRTALGAGDLLQPPARVWTRITEELELSGATRSAAAGTAPLVAIGSEGGATADVARARPATRPRPRWALALAAVAVVLLVVGGGVTVWQLLRPTPAAVVATAELDPFPGWRGAGGIAELEQTRG